MPHHLWFRLALPAHGRLIALTALVALIALVVPAPPVAGAADATAGAPWTDPVADTAVIPTADRSSDRLVVWPVPDAGLDLEADLLGVGVVAGAIPGLGAQVLSVPPGRARALERLLALHPAVAHVERDAVVRPAAVVPDDPFWSQQWGLAQLAAPDAWAVTTGSTDVTIAVLDTGLTPSADLADQVLVGHNVLDGSTDVTDLHGHGTRVAGIAAAATDNGIGTAGYCWTCQILPVKVLDDVGYASDVARGIVWAADAGADVISISLVTTVDSRSVREAVQHAVQAGVVVVAAAGNAGVDTPTYPAALPDVIGVAATDREDVLHSWSNRGSWVEVAAPGTHVTTGPDGRVGSMSGTSSATPAVAGIVGLALALDDPPTPEDIRAALAEGAIPVAGIAGGRVDAGGAITALAGVTTPWLEVTPLRHRGTRAASLRWDPALGTPAEVRRDGHLIAIVEGDTHVDRPRTRAARDVGYEVCGPGGCTAPATASW